MIGQVVSEVLGTYFATTGAAIILGAMLLVAFLLLVPMSLGQMARGSITVGGGLWGRLSSSLATFERT